MFETNPEFNNIVPPVSSNHKKSTKIIVFILILIVVIVGVYFFINNYKQNNKTPVTSQKQIFSILDTTKMPVGFLADFPKNGLIKVLGSEQKDVNSAKTEGVLSFSSTKTVQENGGGRWNCHALK